MLALVLMGSQGPRDPRGRAGIMERTETLVDRDHKDRRARRVILELQDKTALLAPLALLDPRARRAKMGPKALMVRRDRVDRRGQLGQPGRKVPREIEEKEGRTARLVDQEPRDRGDLKDAVATKDQPVRSVHRDLVVAVESPELGEPTVPRDQRVHKENRVNQVQWATRASQDATVTRDQQVRKGRKDQMVAQVRTASVEMLASEALQGTRDLMEHVDRSVILDSEARMAPMVNQENVERPDQVETEVRKVQKVHVDPKDARLCAIVTALIIPALAVQVQCRNRNWNMRREKRPAEETRLRRQRTQLIARRRAQTATRRAVTTMRRAVTVPRTRTTKTTAHQTALSMMKAKNSRSTSATCC